MATIVFLIFGSGEVQSWNDIEIIDNNKKEFNVRKNSSDNIIIDK